MRTLLVMTVGQTDVQLVLNEERHKLDGNTCGTLHDAIKERSWSVVDAPSMRSRDFIKIFHVEEEDKATRTILGTEGKPEVTRVGEGSSTLESRRVIAVLPQGELQLCTPKLDAVLTYLGDVLPTSALIFETNRQHARDPRLAGEVMERRLRDHGVENVTRVAFLTGNEQLEDRSDEVDAVVRRSVVATLSNAIGLAAASLKRDDRVFVATTGGLAAANELVNELVRLHCVGGPSVTALEVPDGDRAKQDDRAVEEKFHPAAGYSARWHALSLVEKGNLLGAWGAVRHLEGAPGQECIQVIKWLADFASSLPLPPACDLAVLNHQRMAVRAALRVELALRAEDIPRAVHGTVAFFEAALWDWIRAHDFKAEVIIQVSDTEYQLPQCPSQALKRRFRKNKNGTGWRINDFSDGIDAWLPVLNKPALKAFWDAMKDDIKNLRHDVAHNEPTPALMNDARGRMQAASLWSSSNTFLSQPLVQAMLQELGVASPDALLADLLCTVRSRLLHVGNAP